MERISSTSKNDGLYRTVYEPYFYIFEDLILVNDLQTFNKRNQGFDFLKGISCIFIVFLHCPFPSILGDIIIYSCRFPVPIFFMISGYYCSKKDRSWIVKKALSILKMILITELLYGVWSCLYAVLFKKTGITDYINQLSAFNHPIRALFCGTLFNGTLWYLYAAFWTYCILYFFWHKKKVKKFFYLLIPVLLGLQIWGRFYWQNHYDINSDVYLFRNALLFGLPLTLYGALLAESEVYIKKRINWQVSVLIVLLGGVIMIAEYFISGQYMDFHLSTVFISTGLFLLSLTFPFAAVRWTKGLSYIGYKLSMMIFLSQIFFITLMELLSTKYGFCSGFMFSWVKPVLVCCSAGVFAFLINGFIKTKQSRIRNI